MQNLIKRLEKRGWENNEISRAVRILQAAKRNKTKEVIFLERHIYWILLLVLIASNFAISVALAIPLMILRGAPLYLIVAVLGLIFGLLFELVIRGIEHLESSHHLALVFFIPVIALVNIFVVSNISNNLAGKFGLHNTQNPITISLIYAISFVLPYIFYRFILKAEYYAKE